MIAVNLYQELRQRLSRVLGSEYVCGLFNENSDTVVNAGLGDRWPLLVKPGSSDEIAVVVKCCAESGIPVATRGGGTGLVHGIQAGAVVIISTERLNKIIELNLLDRTVTTEAGVITAVLKNHLFEKGLRMPVIPGSEDSCFIGGNIATNAGSPASALYGMFRHYVLNLEVVLADGTIMWTGANVLKNAAGYSLTQLFTGSEGTLGIITKAVLKLIPVPKASVTILAPFRSRGDAVKAMEEIIKDGLSPVLLELIDETALRLAASYIHDDFPYTDDGTGAHLLVGAETDSEEELIARIALYEKALSVHVSGECLVATDQQAKDKLWKLRESIGAALSSGKMLYRDVDAVVPRSRIAQLLDMVDEICAANEQPVVVFGHLLDGNLHTMLLYDAGPESPAKEKAEYCAEKIYEAVSKLMGSISGEHGIGTLQKKYLAELYPQQYTLMKKIKLALDPKGLLNKGNIV